MYAPQGVRCNAICPGGTRTNIAESMPRERLDPAGAARAGAYAALSPALLDPEDIAALALFLASDEARHINGAIIPADGGWTAAELSRPGGAASSGASTGGGTTDRLLTAGIGPGIVPPGAP